ncbi:methyltransferase domain-containing protein [Thiomicrospira sp. R3]|uniref:class I SAM-dependent methyltransferase n=1 Tax=Thiomicrospira sp. R3 TaxID=3035472 RepID=UPI00259B2CFB|nr:methyltransferase domain-containing protein [Thiomicrospira sp. R3]WFE68419.1 methyltransferase domain-containing protein [Thiomicrospira sp. R3]
MQTHRFQAFLREWFSSRVGAALFAQERDLVEKELARLFGYYLLQIGHISSSGILSTSRIKNKIIIDDQALFTAEQLVVANLDFLPFKAESVDVIVMPHTLESVPDPYHLVRQVDSILRSEGALVITGFNSIGCTVLRSRLGSARKDLRKAHFINMHRIIDWLNLLGYEIKVAKHGPISCLANRKGRLDSWFWNTIERFERWLDKVGIHFGNVYIIVAKKRDITPKPVGLDWKLANWLPLSNKGRVAASCEQHKIVNKQDVQ